LTVSRSAAGPNTYKTVREALNQARPGDHVLIQEERVEEVLVLEDHRRGKEVTIEGAAPGKSVVWACPKLGKDDKFVKIADLDGLRLKNITFDGQGQVAEIIYVTGLCPGLKLEDLQLQGFTRDGITFWNASGGTDRSAITLRRVRVAAPAKDAEAAFVFHANPRVSPSSNQHFVVEDCRLEGPFARAAVELLSPVVDVTFRHDRFFNAPDGFFYKKAVPRYQLQLTLEGNTFADISRAALYFEASPVADGSSQVALNGNLFSRTAALARVEEEELQPGVAPPPRYQPAAQGNVRDTLSKEGNVPVGAKEMSFALPADPTAGNFLLYPADSPLAGAGPDGKPVGVPPQ